MKNSIEKKYAVVFSLLVTLVVVVCWCANAMLSSRYYISKKLTSIKNMYGQLDTASVDYGTDSNEFRTIFESNATTFNCDILILDQNMNVLAANVMDESVETDRLLGYFFNKNENSQPPNIIEKSDNYTLQLSRYSKTGSEYLELWGVLSTGNPIVIKSAVASINNSARLANKLLAYIGFIAVIISYFLCKVIANIISKNAKLELELKKRTEIDEMRKEFLSNVSHELKTPIALIQGYAEGLQDCVNDDEDSRNFYCDVIIDETAKMNKLVRNLLELNELEFGQDNISYEEFDISELIKNCLMSYDVIIKNANINLEFDNPGSVIVVSDELKIEQVFNNYLTNAINHIDGEKKIKVSITKEKDNKVKVTVYNTGKNIPNDSIERIWDKFYKVDKARTREYGGSGVGLSIVKASLDALNQKCGVINCTDGVEFWFEVESK